MLYLVESGPMYNEPDEADEPIEALEQLVERTPDFPNGFEADEIAIVPTKWGVSIILHGGSVGKKPSVCTFTTRGAAMRFIEVLTCAAAGHFDGQAES